MSSDEDEAPPAQCRKPASHFTSSSYSQELASDLVVRAGSYRASADTSREVRNACTHSLLSSDGLMARTQASEDACARTDARSYYNPKLAKSVGRMLPVDQLLPAQRLAQAKIDAKGCNANFTRGSNHGFTHGYGKQVDNESASDSDDGGLFRGGRGEQGDEEDPGLPRGPWQKEIPNTGRDDLGGADLVGWKVMTFFRSTNSWYDGVIVDYDASSSQHVVFSMIDHQHERFKFPDGGICFHKLLRFGRSQHRATVTAAMKQPIHMDTDDNDED